MAVPSAARWQIAYCALTYVVITSWRVNTVGREYDETCLDAQIRAHREPGRDSGLGLGRRGQDLLSHALVAGDRGAARGRRQGIFEGQSRRDDHRPCRAVRRSLDYA